MIDFNIKTGIFHLMTHRTSYLFQILDTGHPAHLYYGQQIRNNERFENLYRPLTISYGCTTAYSAENPGFSLDMTCLENAAWGKGDYRSPSIMLEDYKGDRTFDFLYKSHRILRGKPSLPGLPSPLQAGDPDVQTLELELTDAPREVSLILSYSVFPASDVISRSVRVINRSGRNLKLEKIMSFNLDFNTSRWNVTTLDGAWIRERHPHTTALRPGVTGISSRRGFSSSNHSPFLMIQDPDTTEMTGDCYGFALVYSGNHQCDAEVSPHGLTRIQMGINSFDFSWLIKGGESFQAPEAVLTFSPEGRNGMSRQFHRFVREHIVRGKWQYRERPVLINNWEATYFDFDEERLLALAGEAGRLGVELFVLDDGWFGRRNNDSCALGDWWINTSKLPEGLKGLGDKIRKLGMDFGLWVEPEMISVESDLYKAHPEWMVRSPSLEPSPGRNQFLLDLTRRDVRDYLVSVLTEIFSSAPISYVKWDMNRNISDVYSLELKPDRQKEFNHRYILGLYEILEKLNSDFPDILFESCASGGNRFDLGMLCYMPQIWTSDNTDARERLPIQFGSSYFAPPSVMGAHVSAVPNHQVLRNTSLESRFNTAAFGLLGYELDLTRLDSSEKSQIREQIRFYKKHSKILQFGEFYRLEDPEETGEYTWICVGGDKKEALLGWYQGMARPNPGFRRIRLTGLDESLLYDLNNRVQYQDIRQWGDLISLSLPFDMKIEESRPDRLQFENLREVERTGMAAFGDQLMFRGFEPVRQFYGTGMDENVAYAGDFGSRIYYLKSKD